MNFKRTAHAPAAAPRLLHVGEHLSATSQEPPAESAKRRLIAFYLPQFHPIPENDQWWGKGFTEWTNVTKARPLFPGHYQPHLPSDLGFYDLRLPEVREAQAAIARQHGIHGFCYYHYWFNGRRMLEQPFNDVLALGQPDFPFCLCWANENWTRNWDGGHREMLVPQSYSAADDHRHIDWLLRAFEDPRYIQIDDRPLMVIYRPRQLPNIHQTLDIWREAAVKRGFKGLYICRVENFADERGDPTRLGFDASIEFQPDGLALGKPLNTKAKRSWFGRARPANQAPKGRRSSNMPTWCGECWPNRPSITSVSPACRPPGITRPAESKTAWCCVTRRPSCMNIG